jgi:hypothetical protein
MHWLLNANWGHTDVDMRLGAVIDGICPGKIQDGGLALALESYKRVLSLEREARCPQQRGERPQGRHLEVHSRSTRDSGRREE